LKSTPSISSSGEKLKEVDRLVNMTTIEGKLVLERLFISPKLLSGFLDFVSDFRTVPLAGFADLLFGTLAFGVLLVFAILISLPYFLKNSHNKNLVLFPHVMH
jgi:hypothetical protein